MSRKLFIPLFLLGTFASSMVNGQDVKSKFGKGIAVTASDSSMSMKFNARIQSLYEGKFDMENNSSLSSKFLIRRARLKFGGFAYTPKLTYKMELGLSNRDHGGEIPQTGNTSNLILDAVVKWNFYKNFSVWIGQTKLPGNRERVVSSQNLQFVDRSLVNSKFNIDRDAGVQLHHHFKVGKTVFKQAFSVSLGEGRNITAANSGGYDYTARVEMLPLGGFTGKGDYFLADLKREEAPKLALGLTYDYNDGASRKGGQLGSFLDGNTDLRAWFADAIFKYQGFSFLTEFAGKTTDNPVVESVIEEGKTVVKQAFYTGTGFNAQAGYLFKNNVEIAGRYTTVMPETATQNNDISEYTLALSKYVSGHNLKVQTDGSVVREKNKPDVFMFRFQVEMGF